MFNISSYLQKLTKSLDSTEFQNKKIIEIINKYTNGITEEDIEIKDFMILLKKSPAQKNSIFLYKAKILEEIKSTTNYTITDIR